MLEGRLTLEARNQLLESMTDEVGELVLDDNRRQTLALSVAERGGVAALPVQVRTLELLEAAGRLDRRVEGLETSEELLRRAGDNRGLTRPELAVLLSLAKLSLQNAAEELRLAEDPLMHEQLLAAFPAPLREAHRDALLRHRLGNEIVATKVANRFVNRMGPSIALDLTEEEGSSLAQVVVAFLTAERLLKLDVLFQRIEDAPVSESVRLDLMAMAAQSIRSHMSDILRAGGGESNVSELVALLEPGLTTIDAEARSIIRDEVKAQAVSLRSSLESMGAEQTIVRGLVKLYELDGVFGIAGLSARKDMDALQLTHAYVRIGEALGIDWAQSQALKLQPTDQWERLLVAGLLNEFEQLRIDWLSQVRSDDPVQSVERWAERQEKRIDQFRRLISRARSGGAVSVPMLAQIASQARILLAR